LDKNISSVLKSLIPVVEGLGKTLGKHYEIVLHNVNNTESSVIAIENGHITGRKVGAPSTDLLLELINSEEVDKENMELNYTTTTKDGRKLKCSTILIRDEEEEIVGALCVNLDLTHVNMAKNFLDAISLIEKKESKEKFPENTSDFLQTMIENGLSRVDKQVPLLTKDDKLKIVQYLDKNNVFNIKGSVNTLANELKVSKYTIYNYLEEVRAKMNA
jgi:predicted transcriptional regulator YheO